MHLVAELALIAVILVVGYSLEWIPYLLLTAATVCLYLITIVNGFRDGYNQAIDDRIY